MPSRLSVFLGLLGWFYHLPIARGGTISRMAIIHRFPKTSVAAISSTSALARTMPKYEGVRYWVQNYADSEVEDLHTIEDFMHQEPVDRLRSFQHELHNISKGNYSDEYLGGVLSPKRRVKHGSYSNWARLMLLKTARRHA